MYEANQPKFPQFENAFQMIRDARLRMYSCFLRDLAIASKFGKLAPNVCSKLASYYR
jgi:hypothetical protein